MLEAKSDWNGACYRTSSYESEGMSQMVPKWANSLQYSLDSWIVMG